MAGNVVFHKLKKISLISVVSNSEGELTVPELVNNLFDVKVVKLTINWSFQTKL